MNARSIARLATIAVMGVAVTIATADGFAQSYSGLYRWALEHGVHGWKADSFPALVDLFIVVGELGLFLLAIDGHRLRRAFLPWADLAMPALVAAAGWSASLVFNVGHVEHRFSFQATAAVPPITSMLGLLILLRTLHRYVAAQEPSAEPGPVRQIVEHANGDDGELLQLKAARVFADDVTAGRTPGIRAIKQQLRVGQNRAKEVRAYLSVLASQ